MRLYGVQNVTVKNTIFSNTGRGGASLRFDEASWDKIAVSNCNIYNSGRVSSFWGKVITGPMFAIKPAFKSITTYDFSLQPTSALQTKGIGGTSIGINKKASTIKNTL
jgi:poly(beta-D-mannuronate) lyase